MEYTEVREAEAKVADALEAEVVTQRESLLLIASENFATPAVMEAQGSVVTNRNALGYPNERLYPASENIDAIEQVAIDYAKELWGAEHANVQPHSGSLANFAVYLSVLEPGDRILSLDPLDGGHITHGSDLHVSGDLYETDHYRVDPETERIDYEYLRELAEEVNPDLIISGYSAYPRAVDWERIQDVADDTSAYHLADIAHLSGLIAADQLTSPVGIADFATGSTYKTIRSGRGGFILCDDEYADAVDRAVFPGSQGGATMPTIAGKAVGFAEALTSEFEEYASGLVENARALSDALIDQDIHVVSSGTDTHIVLVDLRDSHPELSGEAAESTLADAGIIVTKATVPGEDRPQKASGLRIGTSPLTARGFSPDGFAVVGDLIRRILDAPNDEQITSKAREEITRLCERYPLY